MTKGAGMHKHGEVKRAKISAKRKPLAFAGLTSFVGTEKKRNVSTYKNSEFRVNSISSPSGLRHWPPKPGIKGSSPINTVCERMQISSIDIHCSSLSAGQKIADSDN